jgi:bifunctional enzyme CysN/CysC
VAATTVGAPAAVQAPQLLRFATAGSVDDGKSTLIGRLLYDSKALLADQVADAELDLARLTDGLRAEREQGITIDVAYRHFSTARRRFIIADTPGHAQYTRNMVTGASTADVAVVLVDAREGLLTQSRRHAAIAGLLRIPRIVLAVNKMDLVGHDQDVFRRICAEFRAWAARLDVEEITCIPISALHGDNVVDRSEAMDWYRGPTLLQFLESAPVAAGVTGGALRLPVQYVIRTREARAYAGQIAGGTVRAGDEVVVLPSGLRTRVTGVEGPDGPLEEAGAPVSVAVTLEDELDVGRGALICDPAVPPRSARDIEATVCWMGESAGRAGGRYLLKHTARSERARLEIVHEALDVATLTSTPNGDSLGLNDIARVSVRCAGELVFDPYVENRTTGAFILIDEATNDTVAAGMIADVH